MGRAKEEMMEMQQEKADKKFAEILGITYDEFTELDHPTVDDSDNNGTYLITFKSDSNPEIMKKIGVDNSNSIRVDASSFY